MIDQRMGCEGLLIKRFDLSLGAHTRCKPIVYEHLVLVGSQEKIEKNPQLYTCANQRPPHT